MMKVVFIGRDNPFNRCVIRQLAADHEIASCFFVEPQRDSISSKLKILRKRVKRYSFSAVADELLFHLFDRKVLRRKEKQLRRSEPEYYGAAPQLNFPFYVVKNVHHAENIAKIKEMKPDIIFSICCSVIFKPELYNIPVLGAYVLHEGISPQYRGLHNTLWALMKKEFNYIGFTLLKVNGEIDGGEILLRERYTLKEGESYKTWSWVGHNSIIKGMDSIRIALKGLEKNRSFIPADTFTEIGSYYTWMGFTDFVGLYIRNYMFSSVQVTFKAFARAMLSLVS